MFKIDDYVRYGAKGILQVKEIIKRRDNNNKKVLWYVLSSDENGVNTKILTPVDNNNIRAIISKEEVNELVDEMPLYKNIWEDNKRVREDLFKSILASGKLKELAQMIKSIYLTRQEKFSLNKDISERDKEYLENAENILFDEISICCNIKKEDVFRFILSKDH